MNGDYLMQMAERVLGMVSGKDAWVNIEETSHQWLRLARSVVSETGSRGQIRVSLSVGQGARMGSATVSSLETAALEQLVHRASQAAATAPEDPEYLPPPHPDACSPVSGNPPVTASPKQMADKAASMLRLGKEAGKTVAGRVEQRHQTRIHANTAGARYLWEGGQAGLQCSTHSADGSGFDAAYADQVHDLDAEAVARVAISMTPSTPSSPCEPGEYTVVLSPHALGEYLQFMWWYGMDARARDEGRSALSHRGLDQAASPLVRIHSDPSSAVCSCPPFTSDGMAVPVVQWISDGAIQSLCTSRYWAQHTGQPYTGWPVNLLMAGSDQPWQELVSQVEDGLLINRFWYIRSVDEMQLLFTGMTRDGLFRIRNGAVAEPVHHMRFNETPLRTLPRVSALGQAVRVEDDAVIPWTIVEGFAFTSSTTF